MKNKIATNHALVSFRQMLRSPNFNRLFFPWVLISHLLLSFNVMAEIDANPDPAVTQQLEQLKKEVIAIRRDLLILEEDLLFPSSTQVVVYLSVGGDKNFALDSIKILLDGETVDNYLYSKNQQEALVKGGVQKLHVGNLTQGEHEISALFLGRDQQGREYSRTSGLVFTKASDTKMLELQITHSAVTQQWEFKVIEL